MRAELWGGAFSVDVPDAWTIAELDNVIRLLPPEPEATAHFSVYGRTEERAPEAGEAASFVRDFTNGRTTEEPDERRVRKGFVATVASTEETPEGTRRWFGGARVSSKRAVFVTYDDGGSQDDFRHAALALFDSVEVV